MAGTLTYKEIVDTVITHTNRTERRSLVKVAVNLALSEIAQRHQWRSLYVDETYSLISGERTITLSESIEKVISVRVQTTGNTLSSPVVLMRPIEFNRRFISRETTTLSGTITHACQANGVLEVYPTANAELTVMIRSLTRPVAFVNDDDKCVITGVDQALIARATSEIYRSIQENADAQTWEMAYEKSLIIAIRADKREPAMSTVGSFGDDAPSDLSTDPTRDPFAKNSAGERF